MDDCTHLPEPPGATFDPTAGYVPSTREQTTL